MLFYCLFLCSLLALMITSQFAATNNTRHFVTTAGSEDAPVQKGLFVASAFVLVVSALRFNIGWDYAAYYDTIRYGLQTNIVSGEEAATIFLIEVSRQLDVVNLYFVVNAFLCIVLTTLTIKRFSVHPWLSFFIFICFPLFFLNSLSVIRFFSALALTFYGFRYIANKQLFKYVVIVLLASLFHKSALIALVFYSVRFVKLRTPTIAVLFCVLPFVAPLLNRFVVQFLPKYAVYTEVTNVQEGTKAIVFFVLIACITLVVRHHFVNDETAFYYCNIFLIGIALYVMFYTQGTMGHRLSLYGTIYALLVIPKLLSLMKGGLERAFMTFLLYVVLIAMFLYTIYSGASAYLPYTTILH